MIIAIVGSSKLDIKQQTVVQTVLLTLAYSWTHLFEDLKIISGGAKGVDTIAENVITNLNIPFEKFLPDVPQWTDLIVDEEKFFGFRHRNLRIARSCDMLWAIRSTASTTYGSGWTADRAEELGKEVYRIYV